MGEFLFNNTTLLAAAGAEELSSGARIVHLWFYIVLLVVIVFALMAWAKTGLKSRVFHKTITSWFEQLYLFIENMCISTIGPHGRKYIPMIMTLWMVIFAGNVLALFMPFSPTASLSFNLAMALISISYVQYEGVKANGLVGHVSHFTGPKLSGPMVIVSGMIFIIEIISELMKNVSLSLRLYGNIHGGHVAVESMNKLGSHIFFPIGEFLLPIKLLTCVVQALIFTLLTCVYLSLVTHHSEEHHEPEEVMGHGTTAASLAH